MSLMIYKEDILNRLINIYERRLYNNSDFKQAVSIRINSKNFKDYFNEKSNYDNAIKELMSLNYVKVKFLRYEREFERVILNIEEVGNVYKYLNKSNLNDKIKNFEEEFFSYSNETIIKIQKQYIQTKDDKRSIRAYVNSNFLDVIKGIHYLELNDEEIYERNFSVKVYNNSKRLEQLKPMILSYYDNNEDVFKKYNVLKKPTYLYIKGKGIIVINDEHINLTSLNIPIGVAIDTNLEISFKDVNKVVTIENETSFYDYEEEDTLIIYLAGFSNAHKIYILNILYKLTNNIYHYGDIDYGGFNILAHLRVNVSPSIKPLNMDLETLLRRVDNHINIKDESYISNLKTLLNNELLEDSYDVINYMIENKVKLEQEGE